MILIYELPDNITDTVRKLITDKDINSIPTERPFFVKLPKEGRDKLRALNLFTNAGIKFSRDSKEIWAMQVKHVVIQLLESDDMNYNISLHLSEKLKRNYAYLSAVFSEYFGFTIEQYIISCKIEKAKELLSKTGVSISEISTLLKYKTVAHFSYQFKKVEGMSPKAYKRTLGNTGA